MAWLLDTNILSELRKPSPTFRVVDFVANTPLLELYISEVTLAEIRYGIQRAADPVREKELNRWLEEKIRPMFADRVLPISEEIMLKWRILVEDGRKAGHTYSQPDLIIAATALHHGLTVVTRDRSEFHHAGVAVLNPWTD